MPSIDVRALVGDIAPTEITLRTFGAPVIDAFGEVSAPAVDTTIWAVVHPTDRRSRMRGGEADYAREALSLYVLEPDAFDAVRSTPAPWVIYRGRTYDVTAVMDYVELGGVLMAEAELRDEVAAP